MKVYVHIVLVILAWLVSPSVLAADSMKIELGALFDTRRSAALIPNIDLVSNVGIYGSQRFTFKVRENHILGFILHGEASYQQFSAPSGYGLVDTAAFGFGGAAGFHLEMFGSGTLNVLAGARGQNILFSPSTNNLNFATVITPEVSASFMLVLLSGRGHAISAGFNGAYQTSGTDSGTGVTISSGYHYGGQLVVDFTPGKVPLALTGTLRNQTWEASSGRQTSMVVGVGLRIGAGIVSSRRR